MRKLFFILFLAVSLLGCQQKVKRYEGEQVWTGKYDHPTDSNYTIYTLTYNSQNKPPEIKMETFDEKDIQQKVIIRELSIIGKDREFVILAPSNILNTDEYDEKRDSLKFTIVNENEAKITSYDKTFVMSMKRDKK